MAPGAALQFPTERQTRALISIPSMSGSARLLEMFISHEITLSVSSVLSVASFRAMMLPPMVGSPVTSICSTATSVPAIDCALDRV